jgi:hypothetical protein
MNVTLEAEGGLGLEEADDGATGRSGDLTRMTTEPGEGLATCRR